MTKERGEKEERRGDKTEVVPVFLVEDCELNVKRFIRIRIAVRNVSKIIKEGEGREGEGRGGEGRGEGRGREGTVP